VGRGSTSEGAGHDYSLIGILLYSAVVAVEWALRPWFGEIAH
jgi:hypothetical protein